MGHAFRREPGKTFLGGGSCTQWESCIGVNRGRNGVCRLVHTDATCLRYTPCFWLLWRKKKKCVCWQRNLKRVFFAGLEWVPFPPVCSFGFGPFYIHLRRRLQLTNACWEQRDLWPLIFLLLLLFVWRVDAAVDLHGVRIAPLPMGGFIALVWRSRYFSRGIFSLLWTPAFFFSQKWLWKMNIYIFCRAIWN